MVFPRTTCISIQMTESHDLRIVEVWRSSCLLWRPSHCILRLKAVPTRTGCTAHCQSGFEYLQESRLYNLSWQSVSLFEKPHSKKPQYLTVKKFWVFFSDIIFCGSLCLLLLDGSLGTAEKSLAPPPPWPP